MDDIQRKHIRRLMPCLLVLFILANLMVQAFVTVLPAIANEFAISASNVSLVVTMSTIILGVCSVVYGALSDFIPVRKLLIFGLSMFLLGTVIGLCFQKTFFMIVIARAVQTIGQAAISSLYLVIASRYLDGKDKIRYFAYFTASFQIAQALGVLAGGVIATYVNWKMLFVISLLAALCIPVILKYTSHEEKGEAKKIDVIGICLFSIMIIFMTLLLNQFNLALPEEEVGRGIGIHDLTINISSSIGITIGSRLMVTSILHDVTLLPLSNDMNTYGNIMLCFALIAFISLIFYHRLSTSPTKEKVQVTYAKE